MTNMTSEIARTTGDSNSIPRAVDYSKIARSEKANNHYSDYPSELALPNPAMPVPTQSGISRSDEAVASVWEIAKERTRNGEVPPPAMVVLFRHNEILTIPDACQGRNPNDAIPTLALDIQRRKGPAKCITVVCDTLSNGIVDALMAVTNADGKVTMKILPYTRNAFGLVSFGRVLTPTRVEGPGIPPLLGHDSISQ